MRASHDFGLLKNASRRIGNNKRRPLPISRSRSTVLGNKMEPRTRESAQKAICANFLHDGVEMFSTCGKVLAKKRDYNFFWLPSAKYYTLSRFYISACMKKCLGNFGASYFTFPGEAFTFCEACQMMRYYFNSRYSLHSQPLTF